jgi:hypothetical protein
MPTLLSTIKTWADGYNALLNIPERQGGEFAPALAASIALLRRHDSLADLATAYCEGDQLLRVAEELSLDTSYAPQIRAAAYWLRFMELRHGCRIA